MGLKFLIFLSKQDKWPDIGPADDFFLFLFKSQKFPYFCRGVFFWHSDRLMVAALTTPLQQQQP